MMHLQFQTLFVSLSVRLSENLPSTIKEEEEEEISVSEIKRLGLIYNPPSPVFCDRHVARRHSLAARARRCLHVSEKVELFNAV